MDEPDGLVKVRRNAGLCAGVVMWGVRAYNASLYIVIANHYHLLYFICSRLRYALREQFAL